MELGHKSDKIFDERPWDNIGWSVSLNSDGNIVAIGSVRHNDILKNKFVYIKTSLKLYTQIGDDIDGESLGDQSGYSISLNSDENIVAIGANQNDGNGDNSGTFVYIKTTTELDTNRRRYRW